jgi:2',3'-cyclic-nucleotide 2'-phosphodiesterase (5'-nucleotidase family)
MNKLYLLFVLTILGSCSKTSQHLTKIQGQQVQITDNLEKNEELEEFITPYRTKVQEEMQGVLAYTPKAMYKSDFKLNTPIGNMMADAVMELGNPVFEERTGNSIDIVLLNYGGIRSGINAGDITTKTAYDIMPFENEVVVAELASDELIALVNYLAQAKTAHPIAGLQITLNAQGNLQEVKVNGNKINLQHSSEQTPQETYYVATSDYLIKGGDRMDFFLKAKNVYNLNYKLRNLFIDYFKSKDSIEAVRDERFIQLEN